MSQTAEPTSSTTPFPPDVKIVVTEMHTGGEAIRIIESGYPRPEGNTILEKRAWLRKHKDEYRKLLMFEPRGHFNMYGTLLVTPDAPGAHMGAIFMHNEGYSTMCGHAVIGLGRYAVDKGLVPAVSPETKVVVQCPCGPVTAYVTCRDNVTSDVRFHSVPCYVFALDVSVDVPGMGEVVVDIVYGGAFYALVPASRVGLDLDTTPSSKVADVAYEVTKATAAKIKLHHPDNDDLAFLYGTIVTDGGDHSMEDANSPTRNICVFAAKEVDRSPCGSGVSSRVALQHRRGVLSLGQKRRFQSGVTGAEFRAGVAEEIEIKGAGINGTDVTGVIAEVSGNAYYSGTSTFTVEPNDTIGSGFLPQ